jgi:hypothetical protein
LQEGLSICFPDCRNAGLRCWVHHGRAELFEEFCEEFTRAMNRLRMEHRASFWAAEREIERIEVRRKKLIEMVMNGVAPSEVRDEMNANAARREALKAKLAAEEVVRIRRPLPASIFGCGGPQPASSAALATCGLRSLNADRPAAHL